MEVMDAFSWVIHRHRRLASESTKYPDQDLIIGQFRAILDQAQLLNGNQLEAMVVTLGLRILSARHVQRKVKT